MSHNAIAAALALERISVGERLVALTLASYAGRDHRAWPGAPAAAARAGLGRSRYQEARDQLEQRGLVKVEARATGRGRASTVSLVFAQTGPWREGDVNAELLEAVLAHSRSRGPARLLLATIAALANDQGIVEDLSTEELRSAAGVTDRTYRRARQALLCAGELVLVSGRGGRGNTNVWRVVDPRERESAPRGRVPRRVAPAPGSRPLIGAVPDPTVEGRDADENCPLGAGVSEPKGGQDRTVSPRNCPARTGVYGSKGGTERTLFDPSTAETPAQTPAETPAANARAGRESLNPRTREHPPNPPEGGRSNEHLLVETTVVTARGRKRRRVVAVDLDEVRRGLGMPGAVDRSDWMSIRELLREALGESMFAVWIDPLELIAIDTAGALIVAGHPTTTAWLSKRYGRLIQKCAAQQSRALRLADEPERQALSAINRASAGPVYVVHVNQTEVS